MITALPLLALSLGLVSSLHCIGMCGPIALAIPVYRGGKASQFFALLIYNAGRAVSYGLLGVLAAAAGLSLAWLGAFRYISVAAGVAILAYVLWPARLNDLFKTPLLWRQLVGRLRSAMSQRIKSQSLANRFVLGMLNGLVPCGLVYLALLSSVATGSAAGGGIFMLLYGIGTFPAMMAVGAARQWITPALRSKARKLVPVMLGIAGCLLILRGLTFELPGRHTSQHSISICR